MAQQPAAERTTISPAARDAVKRTLSNTAQLQSSHRHRAECSLSAPDIAVCPTSATRSSLQASSNEQKAAGEGIQRNGADARILRSPREAWAALQCTCFISLRERAMRQAKDVEGDMKRERFRGPLQGIPSARRIC
jgi:hypothetical protein